MDNQDGTGQYIWLRYATQYEKDGRRHTVEMGIPVPLGASAEIREKLLDEAESGMSQLVQHVEQRVSQALGGVQSSHAISDQGMPATVSQTSQSSPVVKAEPAASQPLTPSTAQPTPSAPDQPTPRQARPANKSASIPAPQTTTQALNLQRTPPRTAPPVAQPVDVPPTRHSVGASMPTSLSPTSVGGSLTIPDFISYIKKNMNLTAKQAMDLLKVKTLSGINLRDALEHLKRIVAQNAQSETSAPQQSHHQGQQASVVREARPVVSTPVSQDTPSAPLPALSSPSTASLRKDPPANELLTRPLAEAVEDPERERELNATEMHVPPPAPPARGFDEEVDGNEEEELEDLDDSDNSSLAPEISPEQLSRAREKISALREMPGATAASAARLKALRHVADDEVSDEQLQELAVSGIFIR